MSYFNFFEDSASNEWNIANDNTLEFIEIYGIPIKYLPRTAVKQDDLFGEDVLSRYSEVIECKMYLEDFQAFGGEGDLFQQFGLETHDTLKLKIQQKHIESLLGGNPPEEGDLLQFPFSKDLFEVSFVEDEEIFYINGKTTTYTLSAKKFEYSGEDIVTGNTEIDAVDDITTNTLDDSIRDFTETLEFDETDPFSSLW